MDQPTTYRIRVHGELGPEWSAWFEGLTVDRSASETVVTGDLPDQAALHGLLARIRDLGLHLVSVETVEVEPARSSPGHGLA